MHSKRAAMINCTQNLIQDVAFWIDRDTIQANFVVKVGTCGATSAADITYEFAASNHFAGLDRDAVQVSKTGGQAGIVLQPDGHAIGSIATGEGYAATRRGIDRSSTRGGDVDALMEFTFASERRGAPGEAGGHPTRCGPDGRSGFEDILVVTQGVHDVLLPDFFQSGFHV